MINIDPKKNIIVNTICDGDYPHSKILKNINQEFVYSSSQMLNYTLIRILRASQVKYTHSFNTYLEQINKNEAE